MKLVNIGFGSLINAGRILAVVDPDSAPIKRVVQEARDRGMPIVILSALTTQALGDRWQGKMTEETEENVQ